MVRLLCPISIYLCSGQHQYNRFQDDERTGASSLLSLVVGGVGNFTLVFFMMADLALLGSSQCGLALVGHPQLLLHLPGLLIAQSPAVDVKQPCFSSEDSALPTAASLPSLTSTVLTASSAALSPPTGTLSPLILEHNIT